MIEGKFTLDYSKYVDPPVPDELIRYTCGPTVDFDHFLLSGAEIFTMFRLALQRYFDKDFQDFERILDFGCGCGRILRFLRDLKIDLYGCDVNRKVINYINKNLSFARCYCNELYPPLTYPDGFFQLVYGFSVFSHLHLDIEKVWLKEMARIGAPGCIYLLTVQGDWIIEMTLPAAERDKARSAGFYFRKTHTRHGTDMDFPEYYEASYHTGDYVRAHWDEFFEVIDIISGDNSARYLLNGLLFEPEGTIPRFRPMGQDLVIARKK